MAVLAIALFLSRCATATATSTTTSTMTTAAPTMRYGLSGKMLTKPGQRDAVVAILLRDVEKLKGAGCDLYVVSVSDQHPDAIFITEVWTSSEAHRASLKLPSVKQAISEAMPMLAGQFESVELKVTGGLGVPPPQ